MDPHQEPIAAGATARGCAVEVRAAFHECSYFGGIGYDLGPAHHRQLFGGPPRLKADQGAADLGISRNVFELQRRRASCMRSLQGRSIVVLEGRRPSELAGLITRHGGRRRSVGSSLNHVMVVERTRASRSRSDRPSACSALARPKQRVGFWTLTLDTYSHVTQTMQVEVASRARRLLRSQPFHRWPRRADFDRRRPRWPGRLQPSRRGTGRSEVLDAESIG